MGTAGDTSRLPHCTDLSPQMAMPSSPPTSRRDPAKSEDSLVGVDSHRGAAASLLTRNFLLACGANLTFMLAMYCFLGSLPLYAVSLQAPESMVGLIMGTQSAVALCLQLYAGPRVYRWSRISLMLVAGAALVLAAIFASMASKPWMLMLVTGSMGVALAMWQTGAFTVVADLSPPASRGEALGIFGTFTTVAVAMGPPIGLGLLRGGGPLWVFGLAGTLALACLAATSRLREPPAPQSSSRGGSGIRPQTFLASLVMTGMAVTYGSLLAFFPIYGTQLGVDNPGFFFTAMALAVMAIRASAGRLSDRVGRLTVLLPAAIAMSASMGGLALQPPFLVMILTALLYGVGYGSTHPTAQALAVDLTGESARGPAVAMANAGYTLGIGLGATAMGLVLSAQGFQGMFLVAGLIPVLSLLPVTIWQGLRRGVSNG